MRWFRLLVAVGQIASLSARTLPIRHYESNLIPLAIAQDTSGYLWLATADGIVRFDGQHYEPIHPPAGVDIAGARDIDITPGGSIWLATQNGLIRYDHGSFNRELPGRSITALIVTTGGSILASTNRDLFIAADPDKKPLKWTRVPEASVNGRFQPDRNGNIWFGCGMYVCNWSDTIVRDVAAGANFWKYRTRSPFELDLTTGHQLDWSDIVATPDHSVWARNGPNVLVFANGHVTPHTLPVDTFQGVRPGFFLDRHGRLWLPGRQLHVVENGEPQVFNAAGGLLQDVTSMFEDRHGTLWFGLAGKGLAALPDESSLQSWSEPEGIVGSVLDLVDLSKSGLTAATNSGAYSFDPAHDRWRIVASTGHSALRGISQAGDGGLLSIPYAGGLIHQTRELSLPNEFNRKRMRYLHRDKRGDLWIASVDGLFRLSPTFQLTQVPLPSDGTYVSDLGDAPGGRVWAGYEGGVALCDAGGCSSVITKKDGLLDARIRTVAAVDDQIWVGYRPSAGFSRFLRKQGGWTTVSFDPENGYGPPDTHFLRRDSRGWIWRGSTDGVYVCDGVHTEPEDWLHLTFGDGVNESYSNMYAWVEQPDGAVWIGTQKGVVRLRPAAEWFQTPVPRVSPLPTTIRANQDLEVRVAQPGLQPFVSRLVRYRLLPTDPRWRFSTNGVLRYAKLQAGAYRLQVAASGGRPVLEYAFHVDGGSWLLWSMAGLVAVAASALAVIRWRRFRRKVRETEDYWQQKRAFLERRESEEPSPEPPDDWSGRSLDGRFLLQRRIAGGGFAAVYRGIDQSNGGEPVAIKLLHPLRDNQQWRRRRFVDEVTALQKLHDSGIVEIRFAGEAAPDRPYLVMEYIDGITLRALLNEGRLDLERAANLLQQIGHALGAAHRANILHRDLKPENIMVRDAGRPGERIQLIDFGIASLVEDQAREHTTKLAGSPGYLAPERWVGLASCRSDVYSLAAIAAEMLAGAQVAELGFCAGDPVAFRQRVLALRPELPNAALDRLAAALAYDPEARPSDAEAFARDLSQSLLDASTTV